MVKANARDVAFFQKIKNGRYFSDIHPVDGKTQAHLDARLLAMFDPGHSSIERAFDPTKTVINLSHAIQAYAHIGQSYFLQGQGSRSGNQSTVGGNYSPHAPFDSIIGQFHQIFPNQRLAAGEKHHRTAEISQIIQKLLSLLCAEFLLCGLLSGVGIAVHTLEVTTASDIPDHNRFLVTGELE
jgi:hypothetical protein